MTVYTFGTSVNPAHYVEIPDGVSNPPPRPSVAGTLKVRDATTLAALPDDAYEAQTGYFLFTTTDVPIVQVSADSGVTWVPLIGIEAEEAGASAGTTAATALTKAQLALDEIAALPSGGGGGGTGTVTKVAGISPDGTGNVPLTAANIGALTSSSPLAAANVVGLSSVATTGLYSSLSGTPAASVPLSSVGAANGVAALDSSGHVPTAQLPGSTAGGIKMVIYNGTSWPARSTVTTDLTISVPYKGPLPGPAIDTTGTDTSKMQLKDFMIVTSA